MRTMVAKLAVGWVATVSLVWMLREILGPWAAALVIGPALCTGVIAGWALLDRKLFPDLTPVRRTDLVVDATSRSRDLPGVVGHRHGR